jgi:hypothetical protein
VGGITALNRFEMPRHVGRKDDLDESCPDFREMLSFESAEQVNIGPLNNRDRFVDVMDLEDALVLVQDAEWCFRFHFEDVVGAAMVRVVTDGGTEQREQLSRLEAGGEFRACDHEEDALRDVARVCPIVIGSVSIAGRQD